MGIADNFVQADPEPVDTFLGRLRPRGTMFRIRAVLICVFAIGCSGFLVADQQILQTNVSDSAVIGVASGCAAAVVALTGWNLRSLHKIEKRAAELAETGEVTISNPAGLDSIATSLEATSNNSKAAQQQQRVQITEGLADIVTNLARRTQALLDRQVEVLDDLESREENPERLEKLFKIDHLSTRMRRYSESLLVIADSEPTKRRGEPIAIADVLRVAAGEVETSTKLEIINETSEQIPSNVAVDLAHLLAELVENAINFSPPDSPVTIEAKPTLGEGISISVVDHGVGMSAPQRELANDIIAKPPELDLTLSRSLGLGVIGRLSKRTGVTTKLYETSDSGVTAIVRVPDAVLHTKSPTPEQSAGNDATADQPTDQPDQPEPKEAVPSSRTHRREDPGTATAALERLKSKQFSEPAKTKNAFTGDLDRRKPLTSKGKTNLPKRSAAPQGSAKDNERANESDESKPTVPSLSDTPAGFGNPSSPAAQKPMNTNTNPSKPTDSEPSKTEETNNLESDVPLALSGAGLSKRNKGKSLPTQDSTRIISDSQTPSATRSKRDPEAIKSMLGKYQKGRKGDQKPSNERKGDEK